MGNRQSVGSNTASHAASFQRCEVDFKNPSPEATPTPRVPVDTDPPGTEPSLVRGSVGNGLAQIVVEGASDKLNQSPVYPSGLATSPFTALKALPPGVLGAVEGLGLGCVSAGVILSATPISLANAAVFAVLFPLGMAVCGYAVEMNARQLGSAVQPTAVDGASS